MSKDDTLISVERVSKRFCRDLKKSLFYGLEDIASEFLGRDRSDLPLRRKEFWANENVSFSLSRGESLALIGRNGAGKTTLLKMLNGLIVPDSGQITMRGRVGALIALGAGFNPILTGRENVFIAGSVLGLSRKEIQRKYDDIVEFADVAKFMDTPVQNYSSGMQVRLGFAVATAMDPDILLIDEVLAVGDAAFRARCHSRIGQLQERIATIFVSHSMDQVAQVCQKGAFLKQGQISVLGTVTEAIDAYNKDNQSEEDALDGFLHLTAPAVCFSMNLNKSKISYGDTVELSANFELKEDLPEAMLRITFYDGNGRVAAEWNGKRMEKRFDLGKGQQELNVSLKDLRLSAGTYQLAFVLNDLSGINLPIWSYKTHKLTVTGVPGGASSYQLP